MKERINENKSMYKLIPEKYNEALHSGDDVLIQFRHFSTDAETALVKLTRRFLEYHDQLYIKETVMTVLRELINNAVKANIKRLYFFLNKLNINNAAEYTRGMDNFKKDTYQSDDKKYFNSLLNSDFYVQVVFTASVDFLNISILNSALILESELEKINSRIAKAYKYDDISEAFEDILDDTEGAGLGLVMIAMLLKNSGLSTEALRIEKIEGMTRAVISIPRMHLKNITDVKITDEILNEIKSLPAFPDNIKEIQTLCSMPDASLKKIADKISCDPGLAASLLKLANSAGYLTSGKINSIETAVTKVGINGVKILIIACAVHNIIKSRYNKFERIWKNSERMAFYSHEIAKRSGHKKISDIAYLSALIADIGQIILYSLKSSTMKRLIEITGFKGIENLNMIEEIGLGMSHGALGGLVFQKWEFDDIFVDSVKYHHRPYMAPPDLKSLVNCIFLADSMVEIENLKLKFEVIDDEILDYFNIATKTDFEKLHKELIDTYISNIEK
jgi:HD-like signal output (HDOD) protein